MRMAPRRYLFLATLVLALALLPAATGGILVIARVSQAAADLTNKVYLPALPRQYSSIVEDVHGTISSTGGDLKLDSGVTLSIPPGSVSDQVSVSFSKAATDATLTNPNLALFDVSASGPVGSASIVVPLPPGSRPNHLAAFFRPADSKSVVPITGTVSAGGDAFTIPLVITSTVSAQGLGRTVQGGIANGTYGIESDISYTYSRASFVMDVPYYQQDGENCWATVWLMFLKSYRPAQTYESIYHLLSLAGVDKNDGLLWFQEGTVAGLTKSYFGIEVEKNWWLSYDNFVDFVVKSIDEGKPVYVHMGRHQGIFIGYDIEDVGGPNETISLVYHDPQNDGAQVAYRKVTAAQFKSEFWQYTAPFISLTGPPLGQTPTLQTIHMPDGSGGFSALSKGVLFGKARTGTSTGTILDKVIWDHSTNSGYRLENSEVPRDLTDIILGDIPVWNMDRQKSAAVTVTAKVYGWSSPYKDWVSVAAASTQATVAPGSRYKYGTVIPATGMHDELMKPLIFSDTTSFKLTVEMQSTTGAQGAFDVLFTHRPLYLKSMSSSTPPYRGNEGYIGDERVLNGLGFGATQGSGSVSFNGAPAEVLSWSDSLIKVKVPEDAMTGDVKVTVGNDSSNAIAFTVLPMVFGMRGGGNVALGSTVVITGTGFGLMSGTGFHPVTNTVTRTVTVSGTLATIDDWTNTEVTFKVPTTLKVGEGARVDLNVGTGSYYAGTLGIVESLQEALRRSTSTQGLFQALNQIEYKDCISGCSPSVRETNQTLFDIRSSDAVSSTLSWSGNTFSLSATYPYGTTGGTTSLNINGSISVSSTQSLTGTVSATFSSSSSSSSSNELGSTQSSDNRSFSVTGLPLESYDPLRTGSSWTSVTFRLRGSAAQDYMSGASYEASYQTTVLGAGSNNSQRYVSTIWNSLDYTPTVSVYFVVPALP